MNTLRELIKKPSTVIVDVRSPREYDAEHIPNAKNIPLEELPARISEFRSFKTPVIFYCRSGARSGMAVSLLKQHGLVDVFNGGGLEEMKINLN